MSSLPYLFLFLWTHRLIYVLIFWILIATFLSLWAKIFGEVPKSSTWIIVPSFFFIREYLICLIDLFKFRFCPLVMVRVIHLSQFIICFFYLTFRSILAHSQSQVVILCGIKFRRSKEKMLWFEANVPDRNPST